jgi:hypothetical protein
VRGVSSGGSARHRVVDTAGVVQACVPPVKAPPTHTTAIMLSWPLMINKDFCKFEGAVVFGCVGLLPTRA